MRWIYVSLIFLYIKDTEPCQAGEEELENNCKPCPIGHYNDGSYALCQRCEMGYYTDTTGSKSVNDCKYTERCQAGEEELENNCYPCPIGHYNDGSYALCQRCEKGYYTDTTVSKSVNDCKLCGPGHHIHARKYTCDPCPVNTFKERATDVQCHVCPNGTYTDSSGSSKEDQCKGCPPGEHKYWGTCIENNDGSNRRCKLRDGYTYYNYTNCPDCPPAYDKYSWSDYCQPCPLNTYTEDGQVGCVSCPEGSITRSVGTINATLCFPNQPPSSSTPIYIIVSVSIGVSILVVVAIAVWFRRTPKERALNQASIYMNLHQTVG